MTAPRFAYRLDIFALFMFAKYIDRLQREPGFHHLDVAREAKVPRAVVDRAMSGRAVRWLAFVKLCKWQGEDPAIFARSPRQTT